VSAATVSSLALGQPVSMLHQQHSGWKSIAQLTDVINLCTTGDEQSPGASCVIMRSNAAIKASSWCQHVVQGAIDGRGGKGKHAWHPTVLN